MPITRSPSSAALSRRSRAPREARSDAERLADIVAVQNEIARAGLDLDAIMGVLVRRSQALTGADGATVELVESDELVYRAASGIAATHVGLRQKLSKGISGLSLRTSEVLLCDDAATDDRVDRAVSRVLKARSIIVAPLTHDFHVVGALKVLAKVPHFFGQADADVLRLIAGLAAAVLSNAFEFQARSDQLLKSEEFGRSVLNALTSHTAVLDGSGRIVAVNREWTRFAEENGGQSERCGAGTSYLEVCDRATGSWAEYASEASAGIRSVLDGTQARFALEYPCHSPTQERWFVLQVVPLSSGSEGAVVSHLDITRSKAFEVQLAHQSQQDSLTGLPNRGVFLERVEHALARSHSGERSCAVLLVDIDHFQVINDTLGHEAGNEMLRAMVDRLHQSLRGGDVVARLGDDEFAILCENLTDPRASDLVAERILGGTVSAFNLSGREIFVTVSIGIAEPEQDERLDAVGLLQHAGAAMFRAKKLGRARCERVDREMRDSLIARLDLENALRRAVDRDELRLYYQPIVSVPERAVVGVEALLRWHHPERGLLAPGDFMEVAESSGLIVPIGKWVLDEVCRHSRKLRAAARGEDLFIAVNLSARQLGEPDLASTVQNTLAQADFDPRWLHLEITETALINHIDEASEILTDLKALGLSLSVDDFGTGYSSLLYLKRLPLDTVKIDRSFVEKVTQGAEDSEIVAAVASLARGLHITSVAEGVETAEQLEKVGQLGCDLAQGYYFAQPQPLEATCQLIAVGVG